MKRTQSTERKDSSKRAKTDSGSSSNDPYDYHYGFGDTFQSEALEGALPKDQNTPQKCPYGLIAEQISGTSFTTPRKGNQRSWLYRIKPQARHTPLTRIDEKQSLLRGDCSKMKVNPNQTRWMPFKLPDDDTKIDFVQGLATFGGSGSAETKCGFAVHIFAFNTNMDKKSFNNSDGDLLIVAQENTLIIRTEFGYLRVEPSEIAVIQRGISFQVNKENDGPARGYIAEVFGSHFVLPDLGPIGTNGLADARHFAHPTASFDEDNNDWTIVQKFLGELWTGTRPGTPFDVAAWQGNYVPYKYDTKKYCVINSVSFDHIDPSIFTVLTAPTLEPGVACLDFVIFPPRWSVQHNTFRPPYYHRNTMSEFMGNVYGRYEAKPTGFLPGGATLHNTMMGHGPDKDCFEGASEAPLVPERIAENSLSFMFESAYVMRLSDWALNDCEIDRDYWKCWDGIGDGIFDRNSKEPTFSFKNKKEEK